MYHFPSQDQKSRPSFYKALKNMAEKFTRQFLKNSDFEDHSEDMGPDLLKCCIFTKISQTVFLIIKNILVLTR